MLKINVFLKEKIKEINIALESQHTDMYELIGSVRDPFSSPYITKPIADPDVVKELWEVLSRVFINSGVYDNQFDAINAMGDINLYADKLNIYLDLNELEKWRKDHDDSNSKLEILECVDDILI
ncbi:hypothetical protein [Xenorhabdus bovienii]|uniref:hypothetical protein n=1 Tax=Xenorhabdus bovienii TaxID=40576 RepID=UPI0023B2755E|nr:hypothetical protein [Xenorhabdus bovienii]MDE9465893.1 hypothetical protein [Xenorhabdus bovienii]